MDVPAIPELESRRLFDLKRTQLLDSPPEPQFDQYTLFASKLFDVPISLISLVDAERQWFKSKIGLDASETHRDLSFCGHAILDERPLVVENATQDRRFADNPLVVGAPYVIFYAGKPIIGSNGFRLGTLCLIDHQPRTMSSRESDSLLSLAILASAQAQGKLSAIWDAAFEITNRRGMQLFCEIARSNVDNPQASHQLVEIKLPRNVDSYSVEEKRCLVSAVRSQLPNHALLGLWDQERLLAYYCDASCRDNLEALSFTPLTFATLASEPVRSHHEITFRLTDWNEMI